MADRVDVPFDFLNTVDNSDKLTRGRERFIAMAQRHVDQSRETEIGRIVDSVCARYGVVGDDTPIDASYLDNIFAEAIARVGAHAMKLTV